MENTGEQLFNSLHWRDVTFSQPGLWCFHRHPFRVTAATQNDCHRHGVRSKCLELLYLTSAVFLLEFSFSVLVTTMIFASKQKQRWKKKKKKGLLNESRKAEKEKEKSQKGVNKSISKFRTVWTLMAPHSTKWESSDRRVMLGVRT